MKLKFAHVFTAVITGAVAMGVAGTAMARVGIGVNVGVPVYAAPPPVVYAAPVYAPRPPVLVIGWQADGRYWDGRRYWARDEWTRYHAGAPRRISHVSHVSHARARPVRKHVVHRVASAHRAAVRVIGWQADGRYWDGQRYWSRVQWQRYHAAPPVVYAAPVYAPPPVLVIGWQADGRYWDGRRYWARDAWRHHYGGW